MTDPAMVDPPVGLIHGDWDRPKTPPVHRTYTLALISLVAGLCGFILLPLVGSIVAIITGHLALAQARENGSDGSTLASAGLWLGYLAIALVVLAAAGFMLVVYVRSIA
ncbi:DUF4190 domain-containing protein [Pengzhenrongella sp.]|jgi:uncharacterized BrkB/YihY/UPF0761 family membrane protein|uniref:DUF4190 domain-containing protein n=1 Tax=Pengzhenrongella sp. TaxID=2888820 RepID=UPI002F943BAE